MGAALRAEQKSAGPEHWMVYKLRPEQKGHKEEDQFQCFSLSCQNSVMSLQTAVKKAAVVDSFRLAARAAVRRAPL